MDPAVPVTEGSTRAAARVIDEEAARLDHLVRAVLDLSRIEAGALRPDLEPHDLPDLVEAVVARTRTAAPDRTVEVSFPDGLPAVLVDPVLMDVVLANLLDNALVHAASPASRADLGRDRPRRAGPPRRGRRGEGRPARGPAAPVRPLLPCPGQRLRRTKGLGIGLSIVRGLVEAMGGTVAAHLERARRSGRHRDTGRRPRPRRRVGPMTVGAHVLLVEDDQATRAAVTRNLEAHGYRVDDAGDAAEALRRWDAERPDIVLLDLGLPDLDGEAVVRRIRHDANAPILILSARSDKHDKVATLEAGADDTSRSRSAWTSCGPGWARCCVGQAGPRRPGGR